MKALNSKKGFFFVLATLIVLSYIVASITLWTKSIEISERAYAEKFKLSNLELAVSQISQEQVSSFTNIAAYHALYRINQIAATESKLKDGSSTKGEFYYVSHAFGLMIENGSLDKNDFDFPVQVSSPQSSDEEKSFRGFFTKINDTISIVGLEVKSYSFSDFKLNQTSSNELNYSFNLAFSIEDRSSHVFLSRNYFINGTLKIDGLIDPAVKDETKKVLGEGINKQFFFLETGKELLSYEEREDLNPIPIETGTEGQGWFYGPAVTVAEADSADVFARNSTILVGTFDEITGLIPGTGSSDVDSPSWEQFGAYILTNEPVLLQECSKGIFEESSVTTFNALSCGQAEGEVFIKPANKINKPFAVVLDFDLESSITQYTYYGLGDEKPAVNERRLLFVNKYSEKEIASDPVKKLSSAPKIYSIEELRDMAICGYYINQTDAPSYLQRLFVSPYERKGGDFGIESFAFGTWIKDKTGQFSDGLSRLDNELFKNEDGRKIRGMPGCKTLGMCNSDSQIGHFRLGNSKDDYLGDFTGYVACKNENCEGTE